MLVVTEDLKSQLALGNEAVQIQVTADYNFHSEESFKLNYWTKVVGVLSCTQPEMLVGVTVGSLKDWWSAAVTRRSLPGLGKVLYTSLNMAGGSSICAFSDIKERHQKIFSPPFLLDRCRPRQAELWERPHR